MEYKDIKITKIESVDEKKIKLRDENDILYTLWKHKQNDEPTKAFTFYETLHNRGIGLFVNIGYEEKEYKGNKYFTINIMHEPKSKTKQLVENETKPEQTYKPLDKPNWDRISWGKCKHAFLIELFKREIDGFVLDVMTERNQIIGAIKYAEPIAEQWANASMGILNQPLFSKEGGLSPAERDKDKLPF